MAASVEHSVRAVLRMALITLLMAAAAAATAVIPTPIAATRSRIKFAPAGPGSGEVLLSPPMRGNLAHAHVNSKHNQPRLVGSNPHQGIDLDTGANGQFVYAPCRARVVEIRTGGAGNRILILQLDFDEDGAYDNLYMTYMHLAVYLCDEGTVVDRETAVAISGSTGALGPHLHFELNTMYDYTATGEGTVWASVPAHPYYRHAAGWNYGKDLDFITDVRWSAGSIVFATIYAHDENGHHPVPEGFVAVFCKQEEDKYWRGPLEMRKQADEFSFDFAAAGFAPGSNIRWFIRARRADTVPDYNWSFYPPKYYRPPPRPEQTDLGYAAIRSRLSS